MKLTYTAKSEDNLKLLKSVLVNKLYISTTLLKKLKENNLIFVNNTNVFVNYILKENDEILVDLENLDTTCFRDKFKLLDKKLDILYEDEYLLIVNKPAFMGVHPATNDYDNTLSNIVAAYLYKQNIYSIHILTRLDKNTSGICIFTKNKYIQELFTRKKIEINLTKQYTAIVIGIIPEDTDHFIIEKNIARKEGSIILREVNENGDYAKTECFVKYRNYDKKYTVLNVILHTGRTHQIRVHLANEGYVLLGDDLYAIEYKVDNICKYIDRQALHCSKIVFNHPITNKSICITSTLPEDMKKLVD